MKKALIAMSGGVDSAVAAYLSHQQGYDCAGVTLKLYHNEDAGIEREKSCCSLSDIEDARAVAAKVGFPYYVFNFTDNFKEQVIDRFINTYMAGGTPNPCIDCNRYIKFDQLLKRAEMMEYDYVVTGHYGIIEFCEQRGRWLLKKGIDDTKDQSYVLYSLTQDQLAHTLLPLGGMTKVQARKIAEEQGFINAHKKDSQDICFVPDGDYAAFIERFTGKTFDQGDFLSTDGTVLGKHNGIIRYTIGQRKGLGLALEKPAFVCKKNLGDNTVVLGDDCDLFETTCDATQINLISVPKIDGEMRVKAKVRYRHPEQWATVTQPTADSLHIVFDEPQRAIAIGQAVVLYDGDIVVGGGTLSHVGSPK